MIQNNLIEDYPDNLFFLKERKIFQVNDSIDPSYSQQLEQLGTAKIVILVDKIDLNSSNGANKQLLEKMRNAMESIDGESFVLEMNNSVKLSWRHLKELAQARHFILFGLDFSDIGIQANSFKNSIIPFDNAHFILTENLSAFQKSADLKKLIWKKMKALVENLKNG